MKQAFKPMRMRHAIIETRLTSGPGVRQGTGGQAAGQTGPRHRTAGAVTHHTGSYVRDRAPSGAGSGPRRPAPVTAGVVSHRQALTSEHNKYIVT